MSKDIFRFKQFSVKQDRCAMKVGTDGVLLGAWCRCVQPHGTCNSSSHILDIGAGTGLISLMLAQRNPHALIEAVEIDPDAASQCLDNFAASPWSSRLTIHALSLSEFSDITNSAVHKSESYSDTPPHYSLIVSNPPFYNATLKPEDVARAVARHKDSLPVADIMHFAASHLAPNGILALIYPVEYDDEVMTAAVLNDLVPSRICDVFTSLRKPAKRRLAEFSKNLNHSSMIRENILIGSPEYKALTSFFYL